MKGIFAAMIRAIPAFILIGLLFSNIFLKSAILLDFTINQDFISKTLCIKKDVVENTCNGKCHLSKQLEKSEEQSEDAPVLPQNLKEEFCSTKSPFRSVGIGLTLPWLMFPVFLLSTELISHFPFSIHHRLFELESLRPLVVF